MYLLFLILLLVSPHQIYGKYLYIKVNNYGYCSFKGYVPGGNKITVEKITAPTATMEKNLFTGLAGKLGKASSGAQHTTMLFKGFGKLDKIAPKLGPALGLFGVAFSVIKGFTDPSPQDILDQANKAIAKLTDEVNDRLNEMKGYVSEKTINLEKDLIGREYKALFRLWGNCLKETTKVKVDECQEDAAKDIMSSRPKFAIFSDSVHSNHMLSTDDVKRLEAALLTYRDYVVLCLTSLSTLTSTLESEPAKKLDYERFAKDLNYEITWATTYVTNAVSIIQRMHTGGDNCKDTLKCYNKKEIWEGWPGAHTANDFRYSCVFDRADVSTRKCEVVLTVRYDGARELGGYSTIFAPRITEEDNANWIGESILIHDKGYRYLKKLGESIANYWQNEVLDVVPTWKVLAITLPENNSKEDYEAERHNRMNKRSNDYRRRRQQVDDEIALEMDQNYVSYVNPMPYRRIADERRYQDDGSRDYVARRRFLLPNYRRNDERRYDSNSYHRQNNEDAYLSDEFYYNKNK